MSGPFKMRSGNTTPFKQMGSSPAKKMGIFDSSGNRISMAEALEKEKKGENVRYTEEDAIKRAQMKLKEAKTPTEKTLWQKEIDEQREIMTERGKTGKIELGEDKGKLYTEQQEIDARLQELKESGDYPELKEGSGGHGYGGRREVEDPEIETQEDIVMSGKGSSSGKGKKYKFTEFPTTGQISETEEKIKELKDLGLI